MMRMKITLGRFADIVNVLSNINETIRVHCNKDGITFEAVDGLKISMTRIFLKNDAVAYQCDEDSLFEFRLTEIKQDLDKNASGNVHIQKNDNAKLTLKTPYYTTDYEIIKSSLKSGKEALIIRYAP